MSKRVPGVAFVVSESLPARCMYDMGFISFTVLNVSQMRTDMGERHYSPEFEFGSLRWSLLCMSTKDALALYLCQQGTVHCKFTISVVNANPDDYVYNEGTQEFKSSSSENDWGFNNVIKFDQLLDAKNGFWNAENDSITVEVGIVLVENVKPPAPAPAQQQQQSAKHDAPAQNAQGGGGGGGGAGGGGGGKGKHAKGSAVQADNRLLTELLEAERLDGIKKKIKNDMGRLVKEEERIRREMTTKTSKDLSQLLDQCAREEQRIHKEQQDREKREQQERVREQEKIRVLQEQHTELRRRTAELTEEHTELQTKRKATGNDVKDLKVAVDTAKDATAACDQKLEELRAKRAALLAKLEEKRKRLKDVHAEIESKPPVVAAAAAAITEDNEILRSVQLSLASVMDW
jgi:predicted  nucleic acid-binding Zn-ribbon protein